MTTRTSASGVYIQLSDPDHAPLVAAWMVIGPRLMVGVMVVDMAVLPAGRVRFECVYAGLVSGIPGL